MTKRLKTAVIWLCFATVCGVSSSSLAQEPTAAGPELVSESLSIEATTAPGVLAWKNDGAGDSTCLFDSTRVCASTSTLMANGAPVPVPTLPPSGLVILGLLIAGTTAYTLTKQQQ